MRKLNIFLMAIVALIFVGCNNATLLPNNYLVLASEDVTNDAEWMAVAEKLATKHNAPIVTFANSPQEALETLRAENPRYVAIVDKPENIGRDYVIDLHLMCRDVDEDIYADFLWGIITGYDASAAERMVDNSTEPLVIKDAVATIMELNSAKWFDNFEDAKKFAYDLAVEKAKSVEGSNRCYAITNPRDRGEDYDMLACYCWYSYRGSANHLVFVQGEK